MFNNHLQSVLPVEHCTSAQETFGRAGSWWLLDSRGNCWLSSSALHSSSSCFPQQRKGQHFEEDGVDWMCLPDWLSLWFRKSAVVHSHHLLCSWLKNARLRWLAALSFFISVLQALWFVNLLFLISAWAAIDFIKELMLWMPILCRLYHTWDLGLGDRKVLRSLTGHLGSPVANCFSWTTLLSLRRLPWRIFVGFSSYVMYST